MTLRKHDDIALGRTCNLNGTYQVFFLKTGGILKWLNWSEYQMPQRVINTVNNWG